MIVHNLALVEFLISRMLEAPELYNSIICRKELYAIGFILVEEFNIRVMLILVGIAGTAYFLLYCLLYQLVIKRFQVDQNTGNSQEKQSENSNEKTQPEKFFSENLTARMVMTRL